jgi:ADP-ribose pyrophosphatase YjhB (NUDIX family)
MDTRQNTSEENTRETTPPQTPRLCTDIIIDMGAGLVVLVKRKNDPQGWAIPGGFVDIGESVEEAALREALEETGLAVELVRQFHVYSEPNRDERGHTASVVFVARGKGQPKAGSDAAEVGLFHNMNLPPDIAFDHRQILTDYFFERY